MDGVLNKGKCVLCTNGAELTCQRCGDFYCSTNCQRKDWQNHRYICFPMPALVYPQAFSAYFERRKRDTESTIGAEIAVPLQIDADKSSLKSEVVSQISPTLTLSACAPAISDKDDDLKSVCSNSDSVSNNNTLNKTKITSPPNMPMPASQSVFYIAGFRSPNRCFIRDASDESDKAYLKILETINTLGKEMPKIRKHNYHYQYVLSIYNGKLQRAKVLSRNYDNFRLLFLDQGVIKGRQANTIFEINEKILSLPLFTQQVQLKGVSNYAISDNIIKFLTQFEGEKFVGVYDNNNYKLPMELIHAQTKKSLNEQINEFCADKQVYDLIDEKSQGKKKMETQSAIKEDIPKVSDKIKAADIAANNIAQQEDENAKAKNDQDKETKLVAIPKVSPKESQKSEPIEDLKLEPIKDVKPDQTNTKDEVAKAPPKAVVIQETKPSSSNGITQATNEPVLVAPFESLRFKSNTKDGLDVFVVDNSAIVRGFFGALDSAHAKEFSVLQVQLSEFNDPQPYQPVLKEYVIVKSDGVWSRAKVTQVNPPYYKVMCLEFTNVENVKGEDIRRYPMDLVTPCFTNMCVIEGLPYPLNKTQITHLTETFKAHSLVHIDSVIYLHDMAMVRCKKLIDDLLKLKNK